MARTVRWTKTAIQDLEEAAAFIGRDSRFYAAALVQETRAAARSLRTFADRGRVVPEIEAPDIRELFIGSYRLIYQVTADRVFILAFVHGTRDLTARGNVVVGHGSRAPNAKFQPTPDSVRCAPAPRRRLKLGVRHLRGNQCRFVTFPPKIEHWMPG